MDNKQELNWTGKKNWLTTLLTFAVHVHAALCIYVVIILMHAPQKCAGGVHVETLYVMSPLSLKYITLKIFNCL
jgi:hypothetical protein